MKLDILGEKWKVKTKPEVTCDDGEKVAGTCDPLLKEMLIAIAFPEKVSDKERLARVNDAFWHEYAHAVFFEAGFHDLSWWTEDVEHTLIFPLAKALAKNFPIYREIE